MIGAEVHALPSPESLEAWGRAYEGRPLAIATSKEGGSFELELPARSVDLKVDLGVRAAGYQAWRSNDLVVGSGEAIHVDVHLVEGLAIRGRVVRESGEPLPGIRVLATTKPGMQEIAAAILTPALLDSSALRVPARGSDHQESLALTGEDGAFTLAGLSPGILTLLPVEYEWMASPPVRVEAGADSVLLTVVGTDGIRATVRDRRTREPIPRFAMDLSGSDAYRTGTALDGELRLAWRRASASGGARYDLKVSAAGYRAVHLPVVIPPSPGHVDLGVIELEPNDGARAVLEVRYDDGSAVESALVMDYAESQGGVGGVSNLRLVRAGAYEGPLPPGSWFVRVRTPGWFGPLDAWRGEAIVREGGEWGATVVLPLAGTLVLTFPEPAEGVITVRGARWSASRDFAGTEIRFDDFPPGRWSYEIAYRGGSARQAGQFDMVRGGRHEIRCP